MPPKGFPLTFGEVSLLKWWLKEGHERDLRLSQVEAAEDVKQLLLKEYGIDLNPKPFVETVNIDQLPDAVRTNLEKQGWKVNRLAQTNELLDIKPIDPSKVNASTVQVLLEAKEHITWLDLSGASIENQDLQVISQLTNLSRLRIDNTNISDDGIKHLTNLQYLESLNLYGSKITDDSLDYLKQIPSLKKVFLWKTEVSEMGKQSLQEANDDLTVN
ncbi:MAG: hypothetical protein AAF242_14925 [Bacteroidota bacterium]